MYAFTESYHNSLVLDFANVPGHTGATQFLVVLDVQPKVRVSYNRNDISGGGTSSLT